MCENPQIRQMNWPKMFRKKSPSDELFLHFSSKVQNLTVFSIIYMIRIRFFGFGELIQNGFSTAQYKPNDYHISEASEPYIQESSGENGSLNDLEYDDFTIGIALSSPLFVQEREDDASRSRAYHS